MTLYENKPWKTVFYVEDLDGDLKIFTSGNCETVTKKMNKNKEFITVFVLKNRTISNIKIIEVLNQLGFKTIF